MIFIGGDFAGQPAIFNGAGCPGVCDGEQKKIVMVIRAGNADGDVISVDFVNENPSAFVNAFWDFAAVRVYE